MIVATVIIILWIKYHGGRGKIMRREVAERNEKDGAAGNEGHGEKWEKAPGRPDKKGAGEEDGPLALPPGAPRGRSQTVPFDTQPGGKVGPVAVGDVRVVLERHGDLLVGVEADAAGHQDWPILVAAQLDVMRALQQLLMHPSRPPPLPNWGARPGPASPGRGLRGRSPRPGARGRCARSYGPAAAQARLRALTGHRRQRRGGQAVSQPSLTSARRGGPRPSAAAGAASAGAVARLRARAGCSRRGVGAARAPLDRGGQRLRLSVRKAQNCIGEYNCFFFFLLFLIRSNS